MGFSAESTCRSHYTHAEDHLAKHLRDSWAEELAAARACKPLDPKAQRKMNIDAKAKVHLGTEPHLVAV